MNIGYTFMTRSGFYFRAGGYFGVAFMFGNYFDYVGSDAIGFFWSPSLVVGYSFGQRR